MMCFLLFNLFPVALFFIFVLANPLAYYFSTIFYKHLSLLSPAEPSRAGSTKNPPRQAGEDLIVLIPFW